jgi:hypothetical protein
MLTGLALGGAALLAGVIGAWSPCGFSMVETLGSGTTRRKLLSCATFAAGALAGGAATFGALAALGRLAHGAGGSTASVIAGAIALAAAAGEARGVRILPQIRRQVPEPWRRLLPLPLAAALYGILLGLGFTTFVLTLGVWALAGINFSLGDPRLGLELGLAFGAGRAFPVVAIAPLLERDLGFRVAAAMAERPVLLRGFRLAGAAALGCCAFALFAGTASAATQIATGASDPSVGGDLLVWDSQAGGVLRRAAVPSRADGTGHHLDTRTSGLPGRDPALGGTHLAWHTDDAVTVVRDSDFSPVVQFGVPAVDGLAVSSGWLVYRQHTPAGDRIAARRLPAASEDRPLAAVRPPAQLGRPSLDGNVVVFHVTGRTRSQIAEVNLATGRKRILRASRQEQLTNPSVLGNRILYVRQSNTAQVLELGPRRPGGRDRLLLGSRSTSRRDNGFEPGHSHFTLTPPALPPARRLFWTTALSQRAAYLTLLPAAGDPRRAVIVRVGR